jgi:hypothetical protein
MSIEKQEIQDLVAALIAKTQEMAATKHIGHLNRLVGQRERIYAAIEALPEGRAALVELFDSPDPHLQLDVATHCKYKKIVLEAALDTLRRLAERRDKIGDDAKRSLQFQPSISVAETIQVSPRNRPYLPTPSGCDRRKAEALIRTNPIAHGTSAAGDPDLAQKISGPAGRIAVRRPSCGSTWMVVAFGQ